MIWVGLTVLALVTGAFLLLPIWRGAPQDEGRARSAVAIYKDQLSEVDRDAARGLITAQEADAARVEIKRRLLNAAEDTNKTKAKLGRGPLIAAALFVPLFGAGMYFALGNPTAPSVPFAERTVERAETEEIAELTDRLKTRLESEPGGGAVEGWMLLGQTYMRMQRYGDARDAYAVLVARDLGEMQILINYVEADFAAAGGVISLEARDALDKAAKLEADNPAVIFYQSFDLQQQGQAEAAYQSLLDRLEAEGARAEWMDVYTDRLSRLGLELGRPPIDLDTIYPPAPGPSAADVQAAQEMSEEDRMAFIRSMVDGLAEKLEAEPNDLDGWLRLARAYTVLGEADKARQAYASAQDWAKDLTADDPRLQIIQDGLAQ